MMRWRTRRRGPRHDRGAAAVEFAIVFVLLIFIILSAIDFGRLFFTVQGMKSASREGARTAAVGGTYATAAANAGASGASLAGSATLPECKFYFSDNGVFPDPITWSSQPLCDNGVQPCAVTDVGNNDAVRVRVSTPFSWFTPVLPLLGTVIGPANVPEVAAETTMRCE